jgi:hypothetical protein
MGLITTTDLAETAETSGPKIHVIFTDTGIPRWFGPEPVAGSTMIDPEELRPLLPEGAPAGGSEVFWREILISHWRVDGHWMPRPVAPPEADPAPARVEADPPLADPEPVEETGAAIGETEAGGQTGI